MRGDGCGGDVVEIVSQQLQWEGTVGEDKTLGVCECVCVCVCVLLPFAIVFLN